MKQIYKNELEDSTVFPPHYHLSALDNPVVCLIDRMKTVACQAKDEINRDSISRGCWAL